MGGLGVRRKLGQVETPFHVARHMVELLFEGVDVREGLRVLDAGCGRGVFIQAIISYVNERNLPMPEITGVEVDPEMASAARERFRGVAGVEILVADFLRLSPKRLKFFDLVISNPPYVSYDAMSPELRETYKRMFKVARARFDLYFLFFEKALEFLREGGRMVFITTEKFIYTLSGTALRRLLSKYYVKMLEFIDEKAFAGILAYPLVTVVEKRRSRSPTLIVFRDGEKTAVKLPDDGSSWLGVILHARGKHHPISTSTISTSKRYIPLEKLVVRVSAGVATGRDNVFMMPKHLLPPELEPYAYPAVSGKELRMFRPGGIIDPDKLPNVLLVPYREKGGLMDEDEARPLISYLRRYQRELENRYVVRTGRKSWYAFHEDPPMKDLLRPKILFPDLAKEPAFYVDATGSIIPRHSVYYMVPKHTELLFKLLQYLNSREAKEFLVKNCQRAANGYLRLQSHVLKKLPVPQDLLEDTLAGGGLLQWLKMRKL